MIKYIVLILLFICSTSFAQQEDVCEGVESATISTGGGYALCWTRNIPGEYQVEVNHYKVFDNPKELDPYSPIFGEERFMLLDSDCLPTTCHTPMLPMTEPGVHYLTIRAFDTTTHHSGPSNSVVLTVVLTVLPETPENLRVRVISQ